MSRLLLWSDLHLGHNNIAKYREGYASAEEHHNTVFEILATTVGKRDTLYLLGDVAFNKDWLDKIKSINCVRKVLILGNHDNERGIKTKDLVDIYDEVYSLFSHRNVWLTHSPIHQDEIRKRKGVFYGHCHGHLIDDKRYINLCVEHNPKPVLWADAYDKLMSQIGELK